MKVASYSSSAMILVAIVAAVSASAVRRRLDEDEPAVSDWFDEGAVDNVQITDEEDTDDFFDGDEGNTNIILSAFASANVSMPELTVSPDLLEDSSLGTDGPIQPTAPYFDLTGGVLWFGECHIPTNNITSSEEPFVSLSTAATRQQRQYPAVVTFQMCLGGHQQAAEKTCQEQHDCQDYVVDLQTYLDATLREYDNTLSKACLACFAQCTGEEGGTTTPEATSTFQGVCDWCGHGRAGDSRPSVVAEARAERDQHQDYCWSSQSVVDQYSYSSTTTMDCSTCFSDCRDDANLEENGYIDATEFLQCTMIYGPEDDELYGLFAGVGCMEDNDGNRQIGIPVYKDEDCQEIDHNQNVNDYLHDGNGWPVQISYSKIHAVTVQAMERPLSCFVESPTSTTPGNETKTEINSMCRSLKAEAYSCQDGTLGDGTVVIYSDVGTTENPTSYQWMKAYCPSGNITDTAEQDETDVTNNTNAATSAAETRRNLGAGLVVVMVAMASATLL